GADQGRGPGRTGDQARPRGGDRTAGVPPSEGGGLMRADILARVDLALPEGERDPPGPDGDDPRHPLLEVRQLRHRLHAHATWAATAGSTISGSGQLNIRQAFS